MAENERILETIESGIEEIIEIYEGEIEDNGETEELENAIDEAESLESDLPQIEKSEELVKTLKKFSDTQKEALGVINSRLENFESSGDEQAEVEHDRRHTLVGNVGGVIQISQQLVEEISQDEREELAKEREEVKSFVRGS